MLLQPPMQLSSGSSCVNNNSSRNNSSSSSFYQQLLSGHSQGSCPALFLAPMENLMDRNTRVSLLHSLSGHGLGTFDEACTEFIRIPAKAERPAATVRGVTAGYDAAELGPCVPMAAQLMGSSPELMAAAAQHLVQDKGAPRIDINCGCPANTVTGHGAGSSLLRSPEQLQQLVAAVVAAVGQQAPVSVKMRSGFLDTALFEDNLLAVQQAGAAFVTLHPRTKQQGYSGRADWSLVARAKQLLDIPVVGNGDVICLQSALELLREAGCDGVMIGRGALQDPLLFHRIRTHFAQQQQQQQRRQQWQQQQQWALPDLKLVQHMPQQAVLQGPAGAIQVQQLQHVKQQQQWQQEQWQQPSLCPSVCGQVNEVAVVADFLTRFAACDIRPGSTRDSTMSHNGRIGRLKQVMRYLFSGQPALRLACEGLLRVSPDSTTPQGLLDDMLQQVSAHWQAGGPSERLLVSHMSMPGRQAAPV